MILKQHYLACLSQASYFIGDETSKVAVVVDPRRDVDVYLEDAQRAGLSIRHVFLTHVHADFVSGHLELAQRTGATIHVGHAARTEYPAHALHQGDRFRLGQVELEVLETPGHTPESVCLVVRDLSGAQPRAHAVLTGDTLFIGDVGRPDLLVSTGHSAEELARMLYRSLRERLLPLPDDVLVYPAHGAGSACGKNLSKDTSATLGSQKAANWALQPQSEADFVREVCGNQPKAPAYFAWNASYNRRDRVLLERVLASAEKPLSLETVLARQAAGAIVLDVREADDYAAAHLAGSINVGLSGRFASWVGTVVPPSAELIVLAEAGREAEALTRLGRVGYDRVAGVLAGGPNAWKDRPELVRSHRRVDAPVLAEWLRSESPPLVLDVRTPSEWQSGRLESSRNVPLEELGAHLADVPRDRAIVVQCQGGYRSSIAASLLERAGIRVSGDLRGGFSDWQARGQATVAGPAPAARI